VQAADWSEAMAGVEVSNTHTWGRHLPKPSMASTSYVNALM
jgi:hypothetical protein